MSILGFPPTNPNHKLSNRFVSRCPLTLTLSFLFLEGDESLDTLEVKYFKRLTFTCKEEIINLL